MPMPSATVIKRSPRAKGPPAWSYLWRITWSQTNPNRIAHSSRQRRLMLKGAYDPNWPAHIEQGNAGKYGLALEPEEMVRIETRDARGLILAVMNAWTPSDAEMQRRKKARQKAKQARIAAAREEVLRAREAADFYRSLSKGSAEADRARGRASQKG